MYCTKCGNEVSDHWNVCPSCGTRLKPLNTSVLQNDLTSASLKDGTSGRSKAPSPWFYAIGPVVIVITSAAAIALFVMAILGSAPAERFVVPGSHELELKRGTYTVFYEYHSSVGGVAYSTGEYLDDMVVTLRSEDGSEVVPVEDTSISTNYEVGSRAGTSMFEFHIDEPGTYVLTARYEDGSTRPSVVLAVGRFDFLKIVVPAVPLGLGGFVLGVLILVGVFIKRRKAGRRI